jgi:hypothetical protein
MLQLHREVTPIIKLHENGSASTAHSIKKLAKDTKNLKKAFTQIQKTSK